MSRLLQADSLLRLVGGLLLAVLVWQGKSLCERVGSLEKNQVRMMVKLGIEPIALENPEKVGFWGSTAAASENHGNQKTSLDP